MNMLARITMVAAIAGALMAPVAYAAEYEVHMLAKDANGRFAQYEPAFLKVQPGDTVTFISSDALDNTESIPELIPQSAENWTGDLGKNVSVSFETEGLYVYKCVHHVGRGMIGVVQVGDGVQVLDAAAVSKLPAQAKARLDVLLTEAGPSVANAN